MFAKLYRYKIKNYRVKKHTILGNKVSAIYKKYGANNYAHLFKKEGNFRIFMVIEFYKSKRDYERIMKNVDAHPEISNLWKEFLNIVDAHKVTGEEFETV